jgi:Protein of unknown function (DUF2867)
MARAQRAAVPIRARELAALDRINYADCFTVAVSATRTSEEWLRLVVEAMPALFVAVRAAHRALGLQLAPADSAEHIIGWEVLRSDPEACVLGNAGWLGAPRIVGLAPPGQVVLATLIEFNGITGRALWAAAAPVHRAVACYCLNALPSLTPQRT